MVLQGFKVVCDFNSEMAKGTMPKGQIKFIAAWAKIHKGEPVANWKPAMQDEPLANSKEDPRENSSLPLPEGEVAHRQMRRRGLIPVTDRC